MIVSKMRVLGQKTTGGGRQTPPSPACLGLKLHLESLSPNLTWICIPELNSSQILGTTAVFAYSRSSHDIPNSLRILETLILILNAESVLSKILNYLSAWILTSYSFGFDVKEVSLKYSEGHVQFTITTVSVQGLRRKNDKDILVFLSKFLPPCFFFNLWYLWQANILSV